MPTWRLVLTVVQWCAGAWLLGRVPRPHREPPPSGPTPTVSVIIPARNEEVALPALLASLATQTMAAPEVLVVDDHSEDGTAVVAAAGGATVVAAPDLGAGWVGKTSACAEGARLATGDVLAFVDADVTLAPTGVEAVVAEHRRRGGLVSVQPYHRTVRPYEALSAICNVVSMMGTLAFTGPPRQRPAVAFGPCLVTGRDDYERVGGHAHPSVRDQLVEDLALAQVFARAGLAVTVLGGRDQVGFRMYPAGLRQLVQGWTRSLAAGVRSASPVSAIGSFLWIWGALLAAWDGVMALTGSGHAVVDVVVYLAWAGQIAWMLRRVGRFGWLTPVLFPLPLVAFVALFARSMVLAVGRRPVRWRGRLVGGR